MVRPSELRANRPATRSGYRRLPAPIALRPASDQSSRSVLEPLPNRCPPWPTVSDSAAGVSRDSVRESFPLVPPTLPCDKWFRHRVQDSCLQHSLRRPLQPRTISAPRYPRGIRPPPRTPRSLRRLQPRTTPAGRANRRVVAAEAQQAVCLTPATKRL